MTSGAGKRGGAHDRTIFSKEPLKNDDSFDRRAWMVASSQGSLDYGILLYEWERQRLLNENFIENQWK